MIRFLGGLFLLAGNQENQHSKNQNVGLAHGFLDVPDTEAVGWQHQCIAGFYVKGFTVVRGESAAALNEMTKFLGDDLPAPTARGAFPDAGFDATATGVPSGTATGFDSSSLRVAVFLNWVMLMVLPVEGAYG
jgi:hypothetical protein